VRIRGIPGGSFTVGPRAQRAGQKGRRNGGAAVPSLREMQYMLYTCYERGLDSTYEYFCKHDAIRKQWDGQIRYAARVVGGIYGQ
jgi:hypothetical protein